MYDTMHTAVPRGGRGTRIPYKIPKYQVSCSIVGRTAAQHSHSLEDRARLELYLLSSHHDFLGRTLGTRIIGEKGGVISQDQTVVGSRFIFIGLPRDGKQRTGHNVPLSRV